MLEAPERRDVPAGARVSRAPRSGRGGRHRVVARVAKACMDPKRTSRAPAGTRGEVHSSPDEDQRRIIARRLELRKRAGTYAPGPPALRVPQAALGKHRADQRSPGEHGGVCGGLESRCFPALKTQNHTNGFSLELRKATTGM
jgi:hypothetical protein